MRRIYTTIITYLLGYKDLQRRTEGYNFVRRYKTALWFTVFALKLVMGLSLEISAANSPQPTRWGTFCKLKFYNQERLLSFDLWEEVPDTAPNYAPPNSALEYINFLQYHTPENAALFQIFTADRRKIHLIEQRLLALSGVQKLEWLSLPALNALTQRNWEESLSDTVRAQYFIQKAKTDVSNYFEKGLSPRVMQTDNLSLPPAFEPPLIRKKPQKDLQPFNCQSTSKEGNNWYFGYGAGVNFNNNPPTALTNGVISTWEGCAAISDFTTGQLKFYTDGQTIWTNNHTVMTGGVGGTGLIGHPSATHSAVIVPRPGFVDRYYIFHCSANNGGLFWTEVQWFNNGGNVLSKNNVLMNLGCGSEQIAATKHANGCDYWVLAHDNCTNQYRCYLVTSAGISAPVNSPGPGKQGYFQIKFSPNGQRLASSNAAGNFQPVVYNFNNATGVVSAPIPLNVPGVGGWWGYGVEFSPDNSRLYCSCWTGNLSVWQFNLNAGTPAAIQASLTVVGNGPSCGGLMLAPDAKIYKANDNQPWLSCINNPNNLGVACNFVAFQLNLAPKISGIGLTTFISSIFNPHVATITPSAAIAVCQGTTQTYSAGPSASGCINYTYQWKLNGAPIAGATSQTYTTPSNLTPGTYTYSVDVTDPINNCVSTSPGATLTVLASPCQTITNCPNSYAKVTAFNLCTNSATVSSTAGFNVGDKVLLIQMKGATIDQTNTSNYGNVLNYNSAGNYEFQTIAAINGSNISFTNQIVRTYDPNHFVQLVKVGTFNNLIVQNTITCPVWNAATGTGGIMAIEAAGTIALSGNLEMSGAGFRGGVRNAINGWFCKTTNFFVAQNTILGGEKGEGIAQWIFNQESGKGKLANGGGGGNNTNCGGGGGSNFGAGGIGGYWNGCIPNEGGLGGLNLVYNNVQNKIFLGGGGGGGHQNDLQATDGARGGGMIILKAATLVGNNNAIRANGLDAVNAGYDGGGGGGGGGTVLLDVAAYTTNVTVNVNGGKGANACCGHGAAGGGGGGIVWSAAALPTNVNVTFAGGPNGVDTYSNPMMATPGQPGGMLTGLNMPQGTAPFIQQAVSVTPTTAIYCQGGSVTFSSTYTNCTNCIGVNYQWQLNTVDIPGATASSYTTPTTLAPGVYTYRLRVHTNTPQCTVFSQNITVTVLPTPTSTFSANPASICQGQTTAITYSGTFAQGATFSWSCDVCAQGSPSGTGPFSLSWNSAGTKTLTLQVTNNSTPACPSTITTVLVTVLPLPTSTFTATNACTAPSLATNTSTVTHTGVFLPGATFNWFCDGCIGGNPATSGPFSLSWSSAGVKTLTLEVTNPGTPACGSPTTTVMVTINQTPVASFTASDVCANSALQNISTVLSFTGSALAGAVYTWNCDGCVVPPTATAGPFTLSWATAGVKTLSLQVENPEIPACLSAPFTLVITVNPVPTTSFTATNVVCVSNAQANNIATLTFTGVSAPGASFNWICDGCIGGNPSGIGPHSISWAQAGTKTLSLAVINNTSPTCEGAPTTVVITVLPAPTSSFNANNVCENASPVNRLATLSFTGIAQPSAIYSWNCDNCVGSIPNTGGPHVVSWATPGTKTLTLQVTNSGLVACPSNVATVIITVYDAPAAPTASSITRCGAGLVTLTAAVGNGADQLRWYDSNSLPGNLLHTGSSYTVLLSNPVTYYVSSFNSFTGCESSLRVPQPVIINPIPGIPQAPDVARCGAGVVTFTAMKGSPPGDMAILFADPIGGPGIDTSLTTPFFLTVLNVTTTTSYYLESVITSTGCKSPRVQVRAVIHPVPALPISTNEIRCGAGVATFLLNMGVPAGNAAILYDVPTGGIPLAYGVPVSQNNNFLYQVTTPFITTHSTFYIESKDNLTGCVSNGRAMYSIRVDSIPGPPVVPSLSRCGGGVLTFSPVMTPPLGSSIAIYSQQNDVMAIATSYGPPFTFVTPALTTTTTYYFESRRDSNGCASPRIPVVATIFPPLPVPSVASYGTICGAGSLKISVNTGFPSGTHARLFDQPIGGALVAVDSIAPFEFTTPNIITNTTYYVESYNPAGGCSSSARVAVPLKVYNRPDTAIVASVSRCGEGEVSFFPQLATPFGNTFRLFTQATGGTPIAMDNNPPYQLITPYLTTSTTFYVEVYDSQTGCVSLGRREVVANILPQPSQLSVSNVARCTPSDVTFTVTAAAGSVVRLYSAAGGGMAMQTLSQAPYEFFIAGLQAPTTFYFEVEDPVTGCKLPRVPASFKLLPAPAAPSVPPTTICVGNPAVLYPTFNVPGGDIFEFYDAPIGGILLAQAQAPNTVVTFPGFIQTTTLFVEAINSATSCRSPRKSVVVTVNPVPDPPLASNVSRCGEGIATISATMGPIPGNVIRLFSAPQGGTPLVSAPTSPYRLLTPLITTANAVYYLEAFDTQTQCASSRTSVTVSINPIPGAPTAPDITQCGSASVALSATMGFPGGHIIRLFSQVTGGAPLDTLAPLTLISDNFLITSTTKFYLESLDTVTGCRSLRGSATINVLPVPSPPLAVNSALCGFGTAKITANMGNVPGDRIILYDAAGVTGIDTANAPPYVLQTQNLVDTTQFCLRSINLTTGCSSPCKPVTVFVSPPPAIPDAPNYTSCGNSSLTIEATPPIAQPGLEMRFYTSMTGGTPIRKDNTPPYTFDTPILTMSAMYYVEAYDPFTGCSSARKSIQVIINPIPGLPSAQPASLCGGGPAVTLSVLMGTPAGNSVSLYTQPINIPPISTTNQSVGGFYLLPTNPIVETTTYYAQVINAFGCKSSFFPIEVKVNPIPGAPLASNALRCGPGVVTFAPSLSSGTADIALLYNAPNSAIPISTASQSPWELSTNILSASQQFWIEVVNSSTQCTSQKTKVEAIIQPLPGEPDAPAVISCGGQPAVFNGVMGNPAGNLLRLYTSDNGGVPLSSVGAPYRIETPPITVTTTFYLSSYSIGTGCESARKPIVALVHPRPILGDVTPVSSCGLAPLSFTVASQHGSELRLYSGLNDPTPIGVTAISTDAGNYTFSSSITVNQTSTYYVEAYNTVTGCRSSRKSVVHTVHPIPAKPTAPNIARCGPGTGVFNVVMGFPAGNIIKMYDSQTAQTPIAQDNMPPYVIQTPEVTSSTQFYLEAITDKGCVSQRQEVSLTINTQPDPAIVQNVARCAGGSVVFTAVMGVNFGTHFRVFNQEAGGVLVATGLGPSALLTTPSLATTTTFFIETYDAQTGCVSPRLPIVATVHPLPGVPAPPPFYFCEPGIYSVQVQNGIPAGTQARLWQSPLSTNPLMASNNYVLTPPIPVSSATTYYVSSYNSQTGCESDRVQLIFTRHPSTPAPIIDDVARCAQGPVTLTASIISGSGSTLYLYDAEVGGSLIASTSNAPYLLSLSNVSTTTTYFAQVKNGQTGCLSQMKPVVVTIKPLPPLPTIANQVFLCGPGIMFFTVNAPGADEVSLYETPNSPIPIFADNTPQPFVLQTGILYNTATFYIASKNYSTGCQSAKREVVATVQPLPSAPSAQGVSRCGPGVMTITAQVVGPPGIWVNLYTSPTAPLPIGNTGVAPNYTITIPHQELEGTATYYLETINNVTGCRSQRVPVLATVNPIPGKVEVNSVARCGPGRVTFTVRMGQPAGTEVRLYDSNAPNASALAIDNNVPFELVSSLITDSATYWVRSINAATGCTSQAVSVKAKINPLIQRPVFSNIMRCGAGKVMASFELGTPSGNEVRVYDLEVGGANIAIKSPAALIDSIILPPIASSTTYYAEARDTQTGCVSPRTAFAITVHPLPGVPIVSDFRRCGHGPVTISAAMGNPTGDVLNVYHPENPNQVVATDVFPFEVTVPANVFDVAKTNFLLPIRIKNSSTGCESLPTSVSVLFHPLPGKPEGANFTRCGPGNVSITALQGNPVGNVINLYSIGNTQIPFLSQSALPFVFTIPNVGENQLWLLESVNTATGCKSPFDTVSVEIKPLPDAPVAEALYRCGAGAFNLTVQSTGAGQIELFELAEGGNSVAQVTGNGPLFNLVTPIYQIATTVYLQKQGQNGCLSPRRPVRLTVIDPPVRPLVSDVFICGQNTVVFTVEPVSAEVTEVRLFSQPSGGLPLATAAAPPYLLSVDISTFSTFYIESVKGAYNCPGQRTVVKAFISQKPGLPTAQHIYQCGPGRASISALMGVPMGNQIRLYTQPVGGQPINVSSAFPFVVTTPFINVTTTFYIANHNSIIGCESDRVPVVVYVNQLPAPPQTTSTARCGSGVATFTMHHPVDSAKIRLFDSSIGGNAVAISGGPIYQLVTPAVSQTTTFFAEAYYESTGCSSARVVTILEIKPEVGNPFAPNVSRCGPGPITITASMGLPAGTEIRLYTTENAPNFVATSTVTPYLLTQNNVTSNFTYFIEAYNNLTGCKSQRVAVSGIIKPIPSITSISNDGPVCTGKFLTLSAQASENAVVFWSGPNEFEAVGNTISLFVNSLESQGRYTAWAVSNGCSSALASTEVRVRQTPAAPVVGFTGDLAQVMRICRGNTIPLEIANYSAFPAGTVFRWFGPDTIFNAQQASILRSNAQQSNEGLYAAVAILDGCTSAFSNYIEVIIIPSSLSPTLSHNGPLCEGNGRIWLTATFQEEVITYRWLGPNNFIATAGRVQSLPALAENAGTYTLQALTPCGWQEAYATIEIKPTPPQPEVQKRIEVCRGDTVVFKVINPRNESVLWQGPSNWGPAWSSSVVDSAVIKLIAQEEMSGVYSVVSFAGGCTSAPATLNLIVKPLPPAPVIYANAPLCAGQDLFLTATLQDNATYFWRGPDGEHFESIQNTWKRFAVTTAQAGRYTLRTQINGCFSPESVFDATLFTQPAAPTPASNAPLCRGNLLVLSVTPQPEVTYIWSGPRGFSATGSQVTRLMEQDRDAGVYTLLAVAGGCTSSPQTIEIRLLPSPALPLVTNSGPVCSGNAALFRVQNYIQNVTYRWSGPGGFTAITRESTLTVNNLEANQAGLYSVVAVAGGCTSAVAQSMLTVLPAPAAPVLAQNGPLCSGQNLMLTAYPRNGERYLWVTPEGSWRQTVSPEFSLSNVAVGNGGVYRVAIVQGGCTSAFVAATVEVRNTPTPPQLTYNGPLCEQQILELTAFTNEPGIILWNGPNQFSATGATVQKAVNSVDQAGLYSAYVAYGNCTSRAASVNVEVNPKPLAPLIVKEGSLCPGGTVTLQARGAAGARYYWKGPNNFEAEGPAISIVINSPWDGGNYSVIAVLGSCTSEAAIEAVPVNEVLFAPILESNAPVCQGETLQLTAPHIPGAQYFWSGPSGFSSTLRDPKIENAQVGGVYRVQIRSGQCLLEPLMAEVYIKPRPAAPVAAYNGPLCEKQTLQLTASQLSGAVYVWNGPMGFTSSLRNPSIPNVTTAHAGNYSVYANLDGCLSEVNNLLVHVNPGVPEITVAHNGPLCEGQTLQMTPSLITPGLAYVWRGPNGFVWNQPRLNRSNVAIRDGGTYSLVVSNGVCASPAILTNIRIDKVAAPPVVSSNSPICEGENLQLTSTALPGASYFWSGPNGFTSTLQNPTLTAVTSVNSGNYNLLVVLGACTSEASVYQVQILPKPRNVSPTTNAPLCQGQTLQLQVTAVSGVTYRWSGPAGFSSSAAATQIPNARVENSGIYSLVAQVGNCSSQVYTINVTIHPTPAPPRITAPASVCANQVLQLSATALSGVSYHWSGPRGFTSSMQNPTVSDLGASGVSVYSLVVAFGGCTSAMAAHQVTVLPAPFAHPRLSKTLACGGDRIELTTPIQPNVSYYWSGPAGFTATGSSVTLSGLTPMNAGEYTLQAIQGNCTTSAVTPSLSVNLKPDISGGASVNSPLCQGGTLILQAPFIPNSEYLWQGPNGYTSTQALSTIAGVSAQQAGIYTLSVTSNGCTSEQVFSVTVTPQLPAPAVRGETTVCQGQALTLTVDAPAEATIFWNGPLGFSDVSQVISIPNMTRQHEGNYSVMLLINGCLSAARVVPVTVLSAPVAVGRATPNPVCEGGNLELSASFIPGASYLWTGPHGFVSTLQSPVIENIKTEQGGTYVVIASSGRCSSQAQMVVVNVQKRPGPLSIANPGPVCEGDRLTLSATFLEGATYFWQGPGYQNTGLFALFSQVSSSQVGVYSVVAVLNGCTSETATTEVQLLNAPAFSLIQTNAPVCSGSVLELSVVNQPNVAYTWEGPNGFRSTQPSVSIPNVSAQAQGRYTLTRRSGECSVVQSIDVTVLSTPSTPRAISNAPVCQGRTLTLSAEGSFASNYIWKGPQNFSSTMPTTAISNPQPSQSGVYSVVAIQNGCTSAPATVAVTINLGPGFITAGSNSPVCEGDFLLLTASPILGATYSWSGPSGYASQAQNVSLPLATLQHSGLYTVVARIGNCNSEPVIVPVVVRPKPAPLRASSNGPVCVGAFLQLSSEWRNGANYSWLGPNGFSSNLQAPFVLNAQLNDAGVYTLVAIQAGCSSMPTLLPVEIRNCNKDCLPPSAIRTLRVEHNSATVQWSAASGNLNPVCYHLSFGPLETPQESWETLLIPASSNTAVLPNLMPGVEYGIRIRSNCSQCSPVSGNLSEWSGIVNFITPAARQSAFYDSFDLHIYPNPNKGKFELTMNALEGEDVWLQLYSMDGSLAFEERFSPQIGANHKAIITQGLAPGVYTLTVTHFGKTRSVRIIIY